ncbi:hypothetical protein FRC18_008807 [Serendipita sp. 400]|nr:hypothetical protein FRC18_008807 [Serendipita sp. 400]
MSLFGTNTAAKTFGFGATTGTTTPGGAAANPFGTAAPAFGASAATNTATPTNPFAPAATTTAPTGGSLFGQPPANTGGGLFGGAANTGNTPATNTTGGGLFGATAQPATTGTGLFGQPAVTNNAGTGNTTGTGLFGQSTTAATGATGTGLFGAPPAAPATTTTGGLFGQPAAGAAGTTAPTTGLFGNTGAAATPATTTGGGTGLFGRPATGGTGLFGQNTNAQATTTTTTGTGMFGQPANAAGTNTGLFGTTTTGTGTGIGTGTGLFGQPSNAAARPGGLFGGNTGQPTGFGLASTTQQQQQQQQQQGGLNSQGQALLQLLTKLQMLQQAIQASIPQGPLGTTSIPPAHQESLQMVGRLGSLLYGLTTDKFQHVFYNVVDPAQVGNYTRPPYVSDAMWEKAIKENPDPRCMVPAFAMGMEDLQKRADAQVNAAEACKAKLDDIRTKLTTLSQRHVLSTSLRSQKLSNTHILLFQRVVRLSQHLHLLIPLIRSSAIRPEEEQLRGRLEAIEDELRRGNTSKGRMNEMWGVIGQLTALKAREGMGTNEGKEWAVVDEEGLSRLARILTEQQHGLAHLTKILQDGMRDLAVILAQAETLA